MNSVLERKTAHLLPALSFLALIAFVVEASAVAQPVPDESCPLLRHGFARASDAEFAIRDIFGMWLTPCRSYRERSYRVELEITERSLALTERTYDGEGCRNPLVTERTECSYRIDNTLVERPTNEPTTVYVLLTPAVQEVYLTLHTETARTSGKYELIGKHFDVGVPRIVTGKATAIGADFAEGFPVKGETFESWTSIPSQLSVRLTGPHSAIQLNRELGPGDEAGFSRPDGPPPILYRRLVSMGWKACR